MPKYIVWFTTVASTSISVEAENKEAAIDAAYECEFPTICAQCSGWGRDFNLELGDEWTPDTGPDKSETSAVEEVEDDA
jgi:hypothetical protein